jgi:hypothetical protein
MIVLTIDMMIDVDPFISSMNGSAKSIIDK